MAVQLVDEKSSASEILRNKFERHVFEKAYASEILWNKFGRNMLSCTPLGADKPLRQIHTFVLEVGEPLVQPDVQALSPISTPLPSAARKLVIKFTNPTAMLNDTVWVQSAVAAMHLTRGALAPLGLSSLAPTVYGWGAHTDENLGWMLIEFLPGEPLWESGWESMMNKLDNLEDEKKRDLVAQMAVVFKAIQSIILPATTKGNFGGLNFDAQGNIVIGATPIHGAQGACNTLTELYAAYMTTQCGFADKCDVVQGWRRPTDGDLRARLDNFAAAGLPKLLQKASATARPTLIHGDFDIHNMLYDPKTNRLTGLLDFDFAHVAGLGDEYMISFRLLGGLVCPPHEDQDAIELREALLHGFTKDAALKKASGVDWKTAVMLDEELAKAGVVRPQQIPGMRDQSAIVWFLQQVSPPALFLEHWRGRKTPEQLEKYRATVKAELEKYLSDWGF